jgi:hypothetical protein
MNETDKYFACPSAGLFEFLDRISPLLDETDKVKRAIILDHPTRRARNLEEDVRSGKLPLRIALQQYWKIEENALRRVYHGIVKGRIISSRLAQVRAKYRGEESRNVDEHQIELEASRELTDLWRDSMEHQAAM